VASRKQTIRIKLISHTKQFRKRMKDAGSSVAEFSKKYKLLSKSLIAGSLAFSAAGAGVLALGAAYQQLATRIPVLRTFFDMARDAGISAEQFQVWAVAAQRAGVDTKRFGVILRFTDARIRQFRDSQGEFYAAIQKSSKETRKYFEDLRSTTTNGEFLDGVERFFQNTTDAAERSTVAVGLFTENAGAMENVTGNLRAAREELESKGLLITDEESANIKAASDAVADSRETDFIANKQVASNVDAYVESAYKLEELRRLWFDLLKTVGDVGVKIADSLGWTAAGKMAKAIDGITRSSAEMAKASGDQLAAYYATLKKIKEIEIKTNTESIKVSSYQSKLKEKLLDVENKLAIAADHRQKAEEKAAAAAPGITKFYLEAKVKGFSDEEFRLKRKINIIKQLAASLDLAAVKWEKLNQPPKESPPSKLSEYYQELIKQEATYTENLRNAEAALFELNEEFQNGNIKGNAFTRMQEKLNQVLGIGTEGFQGEVTAMQLVLRKLNAYKDGLKAAAAEAAAVKQLVAEGGITPAEKKEVFPDDKPPERPTRNKYIWELEGKEQTELFLKDFQSFSGQLSEAMLDAETDWDKFWLNMIKRMNQRNLARYISNAFDKMIGTLQNKNAAVTDETQKMTQNIQAATGGDAGGFGWGGLIGGLATLGSAYILSRNMNNANAAATGSGGGDVEVVVNINNSTQSEVRYDGRTLTESGGIKRTVIDIIVEDYSHGGTLREVLG